jgi:hypothetical protein
LLLISGDYGYVLVGPEFAWIFRKIHFGPVADMVKTIARHDIAAGL